MLLGNHHEHYLVRIVYPVDWSNRNGRRLAHHLRKWAKHCKDDEGKCPHKSNKRGGCPMFNSTSGKVGLFDQSVVNSLVDFVTGMYAAPHDQEQKRSKEQHRDPSAEAATEATEDPQEATKHSFSQLLKIVEDNLSNISQFLDPLGINVTVMIDKDSARNKPAGAKASPQKPENRASTSEDSAKKFPGEGKKLRGETASTKYLIIQVTPSAPAAIAAEPEKTESPKQSIYSPLPQEVKDEFYHPNPKIQQAVTAMMAMGFSNEDG
ncbi:sequestosome-1 [Lasius niger]|uniref:Sequestosome-1 n=1 Tax=Lasius niger TaxID=67767 RepID=A0A0J7JZX1_LASNI|nr:sequestosome-1 [Lasius niger]